MKKQIVRRQATLSSASDFKELHPVLARVFSTRKMKSLQELDKELNQLLPYSLLSGIDDAADILVDALVKQHRILIVGDFDADGATSSAIAVRALRLFGAKNVHFLVPNRFAYGYGLTPELVTAARQYAPDLIVTVDNGIANHAGVAAAKAAGIRVVITDHHLAAETLPDADAIVNPNKPGDTFPSKNLAGCGVIFYVMLAVRRKLVEKNWFEEHKISEPNMSYLLDLVALGTVADLVALDHNNRILVHQGLRRMRAGQCSQGIVALLEVARRDLHRVVASDLGFAVAARLNAAGRLDDMSLGIECLLTDDPQIAREIARTLDQLNDERKGIESDMQVQALAALDKLTDKLQGELPKGLCLYDDSWHQGVIGILASRIKDRFNRPVIVFAPGQDGEIKGSARSVTGLHMRDVLAHIDANHPHIIKKFGGHAMAAGLTLNHELLSDFMKAYEKAISDRLTDDDLKHSLFSDGELEPEYLNLEVATLLRESGPWGQSFPEPMFDDEFKILEQRIIGDKHLKLRLKKDNKIIDAIHFFANMEEWPNHRCEHARIVYKLDVNEYNGRASVQLIAEYVEPV